MGTGRGPCGHPGTPALTGQAGRLGAPGLMGETCPASGAAGLGWRGHPAAPAYLLPPPGRPLPISFLPPFASCARLLTLKGWGVDSAGVWGVRVRVCPRLCVCTCVRAGMRGLTHLYCRESRPGSSRPARVGRVTAPLGLSLLTCSVGHRQGSPMGLWGVTGQAAAPCQTAVTTACACACMRVRACRVIVLALDRVP